MTAEQLQCFASTVFQRRESGYFIAKKSRNGDLVLGGIYSENFVGEYALSNQDVYII